VVKQIISFLSSIKKLELNTDEGKINFTWGLVLIVLAIALTSSEWLLKIIAFVVGTIKTIVLKTNIVEKYEESNAFWLIVITIFFYIICIWSLFLFDRMKRKSKREMDNTEEIKAPQEKL
jgi:cbb3-type cytochrome oxidase subunit 3